MSYLRPHAQISLQPGRSLDSVLDGDAVRAVLADPFGPGRARRTTGDDENVGHGCSLRCARCRSPARVGLGRHGENGGLVVIGNLPPIGSREGEFSQEQHDSAGIRGNSSFCAGLTLQPARSQYRLGTMGNTPFSRGEQPSPAPGFRPRSCRNLVRRSAAGRREHPVEAQELDHPHHLIEAIDRRPTGRHRSR